MTEQKASPTLTIADIARLSGTSKATVSRVLTGNANVTADTKAKVVSVIDKYRFVPNKIAQCLAGTPSHIIGIVICELSNFFFTEMAEGINSILSSAGYTMQMSFSDWKQEKEIQAIGMLLKNNVDGIILAATSPSSSAISMLKESGIPFVVVNCIPDDQEIPYVTGDNYEGGKLVAKAIACFSFAKVIVVTGFKDQPMQLRYNGFTENYEGHCLIEHHTNVQTAEEGALFGVQFLSTCEETDLPLFVFITNDNVAIGFENSIYRKRKIPDDISIVGYDDIAPSGYCRVPLTTVSQNTFSMGQQATEMLLKLIHRTKIDDIHVLIKPTFITRESMRQK